MSNTSIIFSFFFCSVFFPGSFGAFFFGGMMADTLISRQTVHALFTLPRALCKVTTKKWRENCSFVPRTSRLWILKWWRIQGGKHRISQTTNSLYYTKIKTHYKQSFHCHIVKKLSVKVSYPSALKKPQILRIVRFALQTYQRVLRKQ